MFFFSSKTWIRILLKLCRKVRNDDKINFRMVGKEPLKLKDATFLFTIKKNYFYQINMEEKQI